MIAHLTGELLKHGLDRLIVDVNGVGYEVSVPLGTQGRVKPREDGRVSLHIHTSVREDAIQLFGFATMEEKRTFDKLISVSGVGPKMALSVLSMLTPAELVAALEGNDVKALTKISGVGLKTAQRMILELKGRTDGLTLDAISPTQSPKSALLEDLRSALGNLGYKPETVDPIVEKLREKINDATKVDDLLREAFKLLR
jgi:Holliday junction DNA helicase RuvA